MTADKTTLALAALLCLALSACDRKPVLRDWYVGRELLEPERHIENVRRDAWGDPILPSEVK